MEEKYYDFAKHLTTLSISLLALLFLAQRYINAVQDPSWLVPLAAFFLVLAFLLALVSLLLYVARKPSELILRFVAFSGLLIGSTVFCTVVRII
jgi:phosphoglycerol transferase MdoB-like AlkP superfamily enzyme